MLPHPPLAPVALVLPQALDLAEEHRDSSLVRTHLIARPSPELQNVGVLLFLLTKVRLRADRSATDVSFVTSDGGTPPVPGGGDTPTERSTSPEPGDDDDDAFVVSDSDLTEEEEEESDAASMSASPPPKKGKGKAASFRLDGGEVDDMPKKWKNGKKTTKIDDVREDTKKYHQAIIRDKENELKKFLGRKLTQGEKNNIRLCVHHPEMQDVWGDLAANVEPIKPVPMEAHPSLKLTLLPFQKESLFWMKEQEKGPWSGGMLADEMGMGKT